MDSRSGRRALSWAGLILAATGSVGLVLRLLSRRPSRECTDSTAATSIRPADFEKAWRVFLSNRTPDFQAWRDQRDWTARKCALRDAGKLLPANEWEPGKPGLYLKCPCGEISTVNSSRRPLFTCPRITAAENVALSRFAFSAAAPSYRVMRKNLFEPCIPTRGTGVPTGPDWLPEVKHGGYRLIVQRNGSRVRLFTRDVSSASRAEKNPPSMNRRA